MMLHPYKALVGISFHSTQLQPEHVQIKTDKPADYSIPFLRTIIPIEDTL